MKMTILRPTSPEAAPIGESGQNVDRSGQLPPVRHRPRPGFINSNGGPAARVKTDAAAGRSAAPSKPANDQGPPEATATPGYTVGYKRPPARHQFQKGQSGYPKGRPKGCKNLRTLFEEELSLQVSFRENGKARKASKRQVIVKRTVNKAVEGDPKAINVILKLAGLLQPAGRGSGAIGESNPIDPQQEEIDQEIIKAFFEMARAAPAGRQQCPQDGDEHDDR
jgi:hypothetical protein